jgi:hypothetical protein
VILAPLVVLQWAIQIVVATREGTGGALALLVALAVSPVALAATYRTGSRLAGKRIAVAAAAAFVFLPPGGSLYFVDAYDHTWSHDVLPHLLGLRGTLCYLAMAGLAVLAAVLPRAVLALAGVVALTAAFITWSLGSITDLRNPLHESGWSVGLLEWLPLAGMLGALLRSRWLAVALAGWLVFAVLRAAERPYADGSFWVALGPALPAAAVLVASIGLLVPPFRRRAAAVPSS